MEPQTPPSFTARFPSLGYGHGFALASVILAVEPIKWLIRTWRDPSYASTGWFYLILLGSLIAWSATSARGVPGRTHGPALALLVAAAILRLVSQVAAINIIGGVALALDIFALLTWLGFANRTRPVSPFWLSALFLFTLPFERIAQRILGYPMQEASAVGACQLLAPFFADLVCEGVRLRVAGADVLVDLPCSGTASLMMALGVVTALNAVHQPPLLRAALLIGLTVATAIAANALRIALLAAGIVHEPLTGLDVMAPTIHSAIGTATLIVSLAPAIWLSRRTQGPATVGKAHEAATPQNAVSPRFSPCILSGASVGFLALALIIVSLPRQALDVSQTVPPLTLPTSLAGEIGQPDPLTDRERRYFEQFGGTAQKARYGPMAITVVQTTSPLRHLHAPEDCLRGLGYQVTFIGTRFDPVPTAVYRAEDTVGVIWKVSVTFVASDGFATSNVAEAIWRWMRMPGATWQSVQRITPWSIPNATRDALENTAIAALDLTRSNESTRTSFQE
ncbi:MAG: exosortase T, partial [Pseudomonadota bacterium]